MPDQNFLNLRATRASAPATILSMTPVAQIGFATTLLEIAATAIGEGIVAGGFAAAAAGMVVGRSRKELEDSAMRNGFWGALGGLSCLCLDLFLSYAV